MRPDIIITPMLDKMPEGYKEIEGALTAPLGYIWASNGKSRLSGEYKHILVKKEDSNASH